MSRLGRGNSKTQKHKTAQGAVRCPGEPGNSDVGATVFPENLNRRNSFLRALPLCPPAGLPGRPEVRCL